MTLDTRQRLVLTAVVRAYLAGQGPVSSAAVLRRAPRLRVCGATVRTLLVELEAAGLLHQPHTNRGRVPTEAGLRIYLGALRARLRRRDRDRLEGAAGPPAGAQAFAVRLGRVLSEMSGQLAVVAVPSVVGLPLREIALLRLAPGRFLVVLVAAGGGVQQREVACEADLSAGELARIERVLNHDLEGEPLDEVRVRGQAALVDAFGRGPPGTLAARAQALADHLLPAPGMRVATAGAWSLLDCPEFADPRRLRQLLAHIAGDALLRRIVTEPGVRVLLGSEHAGAHFADLACLSCASAPPRPVAVSLWGPRRMDYGRLVPLVAHASSISQRLWTRG